MAKPKNPKSNAPKKTKAPKPGQQEAAETSEKPTNASVGPVTGTLEGKPDSVKQPASQKVGKAHATPKAVLEQKVVKAFGAVEKILLETNGNAKKQPRQLRWALKSLDAAKDAALRHVKHNG